MDFSNYKTMTVDELYTQFTGLTLSTVNAKTVEQAMWFVPGGAYLADETTKAAYERLVNLLNTKFGVKAEKPKVKEPKVEEPKTEEPKAEEPKDEEPAPVVEAEEPADEPKVEEPTTEEPADAEPVIEEEIVPAETEEPRGEVNVEEAAPKKGKK